MARLVVFRRRLGWYWRLVARNNRVLAVGAEPFASERSAVRAFERVLACGEYPWSYEVVHAR